MSITIDQSRQLWQSDGVQTEYPITLFQHYRGPDSLHIWRQTPGDRDVLHFTESATPGAGQYTVINWDVNTLLGTLKTGDIWPNGTFILADRTTPQLQTTDFPHAGRFPSPAAEKAWDLSAQIDQERNRGHFYATTVFQNVIQVRAPGDLTSQALDAGWEGIELAKSEFYAFVASGSFEYPFAQPTTLGAIMTIHQGPLGNVNDPVITDVGGAQSGFDVMTDSRFHSPAPGSIMEPTVSCFQTVLTDAVSDDTFSIGFRNVYDTTTAGLEEKRCVFRQRWTIRIDQARSAGIYSGHRS